MSFGARSGRVSPLGVGGLFVQGLDLPAGDVDALDRPMAGPRRGRRRTGEEHPHHLVPVEAAAVVADVHRSVRADRGAVRSSAGLGDDLLVAGLDVDPCERAARDLDDDDAAVVHGHRAFGETKSARDLS